MPFYQFIKEQKISTTVEEVWDFIASPRNLKKITPEAMGFAITSTDLPDKMYQGMIISYEVSPLLGIKTDWVTEITHLSENEYFVDEQRYGPYKMWHHQHRLVQQSDGVLMRDIITYIPPLGFLGAIANKLVIRQKLEEIFAYRVGAIEREIGRR